MDRSLPGLCLTLAALLAGCTTSSELSPPEGFEFGRECVATEDCASRLCLSSGVVGPVCTRTCSSDRDCPNAPNWGCVEPLGADYRVCGCRSDAVMERCGDGIDNDCNGLVDDCQDCDGWPVPVDDPTHCGACGVRCAASEVCASGECVCPLASQVLCNGTCTTVTVDENNCGGCGVACPAAQTCRAGNCACPTNAEPDYCGASAGCVNLDSDERNCGRCGMVCGAGLVCTAGSCSCPTTALPDNCGAVGCVDLASDSSHCGECDAACPNAGALCAGGTCECPSNTPDVCAATCVDTQADRDHCGACGEVCDPALVCAGGTCGCPTDTHIYCNGVCVDPRANAAHCGGCGLPCGPGETCTGTGCICESALVCGGVCMPVNDDANCGACGRACGPSQHCSGAQCVCDTGGLTPCGDLCVQTLTDEAHCGACDSPCRPSEVCSGGSCACPTGTTWCDGVGCVNLQADEAHCGACDVACPNTTSCASGVCQCPGVSQEYCASVDRCMDLYSDEAHCGECDVTCEATEICSFGSCRCAVGGQSYCASEGQCVDTRSNVQHCGTCDNVCRSGESCTSGYCRCPTGALYCDSQGACTDVRSNRSHCGACDNVCASNASCSAGACACFEEGQIHCDATCVDPRVDESHCGGCGNSCDAGDVCLQGGCHCPAPTPGFTAAIATGSSIQEKYPSVATLGTTIGVAWADDTNDVVRFQRFDSSGGGLGTEVTIGDGMARVYSVDLITDGGEFALAMVQVPNDGTPQLVRLVRIDVNGVILSDETQDFGFADASGYSFYTSLAWAPGTGYMLCTDVGTRCGVVGPTGSTPPANVAQYSGSGIRVMGDSDGTFWVVITSYDSLTLSHLDATGATVGEDVVTLIPRSPTGSLKPSLSRWFALAMDALGPVVFVPAFELQFSGGYLHDFYIVRGYDLGSVTRVYRSGPRQSSSNGSLTGVDVVFDGTSYFVGWTRAEGTYYADSARYLGRFELPTDGSPPVSVTPFDLLSSAANARELGASMALENGVIYWAYYKSVNDAYLQTVPITTCAP